MATKVTEKRWLAISPRPLTSNGGQYGQVFVASTLDFKTKQKVQLKSSAQTTKKLEIKRVVSLNELWVGPLGSSILEVTDISAFLTVDGATIEAAEQSRPSIPYQQHENAVYAEEPIIAKRVIEVDEEGNYYNQTNPKPVRVDGISIENVDVQLKHNGESQPNNGDTVAIGNNKTGADSHLLEIYPSKDIDIRRQGTTVKQKLSNALKCMDDKIVAYTWSDINGVRRIASITWTSSTLNAQEGSTISLVRTFNYAGTPNFDLLNYTDVLSVT